MKFTTLQTGPTYPAEYILFPVAGSPAESHRRLHYHLHWNPPPSLKGTARPYLPSQAADNDRKPRSMVGLSQKLTLCWRCGRWCTRASVVVGASWPLSWWIVG